MTKGSPLRIGNAGGFWGDSVDAPLKLIQQQPDLDYLTLDYLAELSLAIMAIQREADPQLGYARDFIGVVQALCPFWKRGSSLKLIANAGGLNPKACANAVIQRLRQMGCFGLKVGVVTGDDVLGLLKDDSSNPLYSHLETGLSLQTVADRLVAANVYLGATPLIESLQLGAQIVITGRVADPSLTVAPCAMHYAWGPKELDRLAGATVAGHLIECGTQVTGGISTHWLEYENLAHIGFPIVEVDREGQCIVTKPEGTGGAVTLETVKEQLLYEIGDPACYLSPDVTVSFLDLTVSSVGTNRIAVKGARGTNAPSTYKVSSCIRMGWRAEGHLVVYGRDAVQKARRCGEIVLERLRDAGYSLENTQIECLGAGELALNTNHTESPHEVVLRIAVADQRKEAVERFTKELAPLVTSGPQGLTGYATGRPSVRPQFGYWPCLIDREQVKPSVTVVEVT